MGILIDPLICWISYSILLNTLMINTSLPLLVNSLSSGAVISLYPPSGKSEAEAAPAERIRARPAITIKRHVVLMFFIMSVIPGKVIG